MKLTDYVVDFISKEGITHVFGVTGGAVVHLFDSADKSPAIQTVFTQHEQAATYAAQAYSRIKNNFGAAFVTTGPGGTNAITGVAAAWLDSIPCIVVSGQTRFDHTTPGKPIRQLGSQQMDIVPIISSITKYSVMVDDPQRIKYYLQKAIYLARNGRPGPVWVDLPLDFQWASIEPDQLIEFDPAELETKTLSEDTTVSLQKCKELLLQAKRPVVLAGYGVRLAHAEQELREFAERFNLPVLLTWNTRDLLPTDHKCFRGCSGIMGQRGSNFTVQNCDLLIGIGTHLSIPLTGTKFEDFASGAKKVLVNVDPGEVEHQTVSIDLPIVCDAKIFLQGMLKEGDSVQGQTWAAWTEKTCDYHSKYNPIPLEWRDQKEYVNPYVFLDTLSEMLKATDTIVVDGGGTVTQMMFQTFKVKEGQRVMIDAGLCAMGSGLPQSIGACFAAGERTICLCGDGSFQFNVQELQTIFHHKLPIKIFVMNNSGYLAIRHTQTYFLEKRFVGSGKEGGVSIPDIGKVAIAYGIKATRVENHSELNEKISWVLEEPGPVLCEIMVRPDEEVRPRLGFEKRPDGTFAFSPLEDMYPYLDRDEFHRNMIDKENSA